MSAPLNHDTPEKRPILVVEDEENDLFFLLRALEKAGVANPLNSVGSGQEAVDYLTGAGAYSDRQKYPLPFLLLLDLKLPSLNGIEVVRWIRKQEPPIRNVLVVVLTSSTLRQDIEDAYAAGANGYITKLADPEMLVSTMKDLANWWLRRNVPPP